MKKELYFDRHSGLQLSALVEDGKLSLDDRVDRYFPEYRNENTDEFYDKCTVLDMLKMSSNLGTEPFLR